MPPAGRAGRCAGFTLLELLVVLVIAAGLMAALPPLVARAMPSLHLTAAARTLADDLRRLRLAAIAGQREARLTVAPRGDGYGLDGQGKALPEGVRLTLPAQAGGVIRFFPDGSSSGGEMRLDLEGDSRHVAVSWLTGQVSVRE